MNQAAKDDTFDLSDSTDWLQTPLPLLSAVDAALRCQVCKDFYITPMITSCSHTFCSLCIRRCLNNDGRCPACRAQDQELKLRFNAAMEDLVGAFKKARPGVWEFANKPVEEVGSASSKRSRELEEGEDESPRKRTRTRSSRRTKARERVMVEDSAEDDEDYVPGTLLIANRGLCHAKLSTEDGFVQCPVCQKFVKEDTINSHLDRNCMEEPRITKPLSKATSNPKPPDKHITRPERLPQLHYSMVKDNVLRKKLSDLGISAGGSRQLLEKRYTEWVTLWNANCDATKPKSKSELKKELGVWERTQGSIAGSSKQDPGAQIRDKDFDGKAYSTKYDDSFKQLIANARKKPAVRPATPPQSTSEPVDLTGSPTPTKAPDPRPTSPVNTEMAGNNDLPVQTEQYRKEESLAKQSSRRRFFEERPDDHSQLPPPSSQYSIIEKDSGIGPDMTTLRPLQP